MIAQMFDEGGVGVSSGSDLVLVVLVERVVQVIHVEQVGTSRGAFPDLPTGSVGVAQG